MAIKPASEWGTAWSGSSGKANTNYTAGVNAYNGDWAGATTAQQSTMQTNWLASLPTWAQHVRDVGTQGWKTATVAKAPNYVTGFNAGAANYNAAAQKIANALNNIVPSLPPRGTFEQNKVRSTTLMDQLHALRGQLGAK